MSIVGINYEICTSCSMCLTACSLFTRDKDQNKVVFNSAGVCNLCGHCIAKCPEDAIEYKGIGEALSYEGVDKPGDNAKYYINYKVQRANSSTRTYRKKKVSNDLLKQVFDDMTHAPTSGNIRSERFTILSNKEEIKILNDGVKEAIFSDSEMNGKYGSTLKMLSGLFNCPVYYDAPHVIIVDSPVRGVEINIGIIITYGRLAAQALGLGTCWNGWTMEAIRINPKIRKLANIGGESVGAFTIGYPVLKFYRSPPRTPKKINGLD